MINMDVLTKRLEADLSPSRYAHSRSVAAYAAELARYWGMDEEKAYNAGLLHDMEHFLSDEELLREAENYSLPVNEAEHNAPILLHGPLAACILEQDYGCDDALLLEAIRLHTVPNSAMSDFAKIIFIADVAEPSRPVWAGQERIRELARKDLNAAMVECLSQTVDHLHRRKKQPHPDTEQVMEQFRKMSSSSGSKEESMTKTMSAEELLARCVALAEEKKARDIVSLDLRGLTLISDYFLIMSAGNTRQAKALSDAIEEGLKKDGMPPLRIEGYQEGRWVLVDVGSVVVHIFLEEERLFYDIERLWADAKKVEY